MLTSLRTHWFTIAIALVFGIGYSQGRSMAWLSEWGHLKTAIVFSVMFAMALPVPWRQVRQSLLSPWPSLLAIVLNMGILPLAAWGLSFLLPSELGGGLIVASVVPSTLASAAVWTRRAGGDDSIPILVTLVTSGTCFLVAPAWISLLLSQSVSLDGWKSAIDLFSTVLVPLLLAQLLTTKPKIREWAVSQKERISLFCQFGILSMVAIGAIQIGSKGSGLQRIGTDLLLVIATAMTLHLGILFGGWHAARWIGFGRSQQIAIALACSQKTLMIGLKLAVDCGVSILPMVVYHIGQLVIDAALVERWRKGSKEN